uniref:Uncharacterized protein n=1 Tax=Pithovirus LCDPAC02 TaxID=2506601 RepID=A0A481YRF2_9VIRU|nr:MAG: hypothetical protein LCDPAC02_02350 [Pithovirus LCDPAC02]
MNYTEDFSIFTKRLLNSSMYHLDIFPEYVKHISTDIKVLKFDIDNQSNTIIIIKFYGYYIKYEICKLTDTKLKLVTSCVKSIDDIPDIENEIVVKSNIIGEDIVNLYTNVLNQNIIF